MAVPAVNIIIERGADFASSFTITNEDLFWWWYNKMRFLSSFFFIYKLL